MSVFAAVLKKTVAPSSSLLLKARTINIGTHSYQYGSSWCILISIWEELVLSYQYMGGVSAFLSVWEAAG